MARRRQPGLTEKEIKEICEFDWNNSDVEDCLDEEPFPEEVIQSTLEEIIVNGSNMETSVIEQLLDEDKLETENVENTCEVFEKLDVKNLKWTRSAMAEVDSTWKGFLAENVTDVEAPIEYFNKFVDSDVVEHLCCETNRYGLQQFGYELKCTNDEIRRFIGVLLYLGVVKVPRYRMAWAKEFNFTSITQSLSRNRFEKIKESFHLNDNACEKKPNEPDFDKLFKVRPLLNHLKKKFNEIPQEERQSIDEQIIPFKGKFFIIFSSDLYCSIANFRSTKFKTVPTK